MEQDADIHQLKRKKIRKKEMKKWDRKELEE